MKKLKNYLIDPYGIDDFEASVPQQVRQFFKESILCYQNHIPNGATLMCKKTLLEICRDKKVRGATLTEKLKNISSDKRLLDFLGSVPSFDSQDISAEPLPKIHVKKLIQIAAKLIAQQYLS